MIKKNHSSLLKEKKNIKNNMRERERWLEFFSTFDIDSERLLMINNFLKILFNK